MAQRKGRKVVTLWLRDHMVDAIDARAASDPSEPDRTAVAEAALAKHLRLPKPERSKRGRPRVATEART